MLAYYFRKFWLGTLLLAYGDIQVGTQLLLQLLCNGLSGSCLRIIEYQALLCIAHR